MDTALPSSQLPAEASQRSSTGRPRHRPRGGQRRTGGDTGRSAALSLTPASVAPQSQPSSANHSGAEDTAHAGQSRKPANRRPRGGRNTQTTTRMVNGRQFGGQLTTAEAPSTHDDTLNSGLQANAPTFIPGQQQQQPQLNRSKQPQHQRHPPKRRASKSQAPDIATRTHEDIDNAHYECPICTSEVQRNSKVWACHTCWTVFHLACIKKWSTNQGSAAAQQALENGDPPPKQWRCPGCNLAKDVFPKSYTCWCEKEVEPRAPAGIPPHSCGQSCGRERAKKCPHPCQLTCHAGPCPPCTHMGPTQICFCGKSEVTKRCSETDYDAGWSCGEICGELMPCGEHTCQRPCHEGLCGACEVRFPARCYCGQVEKDLVCADRSDEKESHRTHAPSGDGSPVTETWTGLFECGNVCDRTFDCGVHRCQQPCHAQTADPQQCPRDPALVSHCPCGKTPLSSISSEPRQNCQDEIPSCNQPCGKTLACGHLCDQICHTGNCGACLKVVTINCRCGRTTSSTICHQGHEERPHCMRVCRANMNCGRHACDERCCTGERKAVERSSTKRKQRPLNSAPRPVDDGIEAEHICTRQCGRLLKCGNHLCEELCHKGPCGTCREAIFEEISCHCGRTVLQPPLPCGTEPPLCRFPCDRLKGCGHPQVPHNCHLDDVSCPKCPYLMEKNCMCGKKKVKNQQCWLQDIRCGEVCGKKLRCGSHFCRKPCHRPGECEDAHGKPCQQVCGKPKKVCDHPDENICHAPFPCKEDKPCQSKIFITCKCQAQKQESKCGASKTSEGNHGKSLPCNEECAKLERNRKLALALNIDQSAHVDGGDHIPYSTETLNLFAGRVKWAQTQEREFRVFATSDNERRMRFKPMKPQERAFLHHLADDFGLDSESMDPEPHRHVMIWKTPRFVSAPNKTLAEAFRIRQAQRPLVVSAGNSDAEGVAKQANNRKPAALYNGFLITNPRFGLTIEELRTEVASIVPASSPATFNIEFLPSDEVAMKANSGALSPEDLQQTLIGLKAGIATAIAAKGYGTTQLCAIDTSLNVTRREADSLAPGDGWSRVAAKKAAPRIALPGPGLAGINNSFAALTGNKVTLTARKKPQPEKPKVKKEAVVDDWEAAEIEAEEKELGLSAGSGDEGHQGVIVPEATLTGNIPDVQDAETQATDGQIATSSPQDAVTLAESVEATGEQVDYL